MIRSRFFFILTLALAIFLSVKFIPSVKERVIIFSNQIKKSYLDFINDTKNTINSYIDQSKKIKELQQSIKLLEPKAMLYAQTQNKLSKLLKETNLNYSHPSLHLVQVISFERLGDYNSLWVDFKDFDKKKIYGLLYRGYVAGIIRQKLDSPLAVLMFDPSVCLSVYIGKYKTEGVLFGNNKNLIIKYIQKFNSLKVGDEVVTSGKDGIFFEGVKIGKVIKINERSLYNEAIVEPYIRPVDARFFYAVDTKVDPKKRAK